MENFVNKENLKFYNEKLKEPKYKVIDKFFRLWISKAFLSHLLNWKKLHKNFLDETWKFDLDRFKNFLDFLMIQNVFTKIKTVRYDTIGRFVESSDVETIIKSDISYFKNFWWSKFTKEIVEYTFLDWDNQNQWGFTLDNNILDFEVDIVDNGIKNYLWDLYNEIVSMLVEKSIEKEFNIVINEVIKQVSLLIKE